MKKTFIGFSLFVASTSMAFAGSAVDIVSEQGEYVGNGETFSYDDTNSLLEVVTSHEIGLNDNIVTVYLWTPDASVPVWTMKFAAPAGAQLQAGTTYTDIRNFSGWVNHVPRMTVQSIDRGCLGVFGYFEVTDVAYDVNGDVTALGLNFLQRCETTTNPALTGTVLYNLVADAPPPGADDSAAGDDDSAGGDDSTGGGDADSGDDDGSKVCKNTKSKKSAKAKKSKKDKSKKKSKKAKKSKKNKDRACS